MKKIFTKSLCVYMTVSLAVAAAAIFLLLTVTAHIGNTSDSREKLASVKEKLESRQETVPENTVDAVLHDIEYRKNGYIWAIDLRSGQVLSHPDPAVIGRPAKDAGLPVKAGTGRIRIGGAAGYYVAEEYDGMLIGTFLPSGEYNRDRFSQTLAVAVSILITFTVLLVFINRIVNDKIVNGIHNIANTMKLIAKGNYSIRIEVGGNTELSLLGDGINAMLDGVNRNLNEKKLLMEKQQQEIETSNLLIENVRQACSKLNAISNDTLNNAELIHVGTKEQEDIVSGLKEVMGGLTQGLKKNVDATAAGAALVNEIAVSVKQGKEQMRQTERSIRKTGDTSAEMEKIIGEIAAIAQRINMLSLDASVAASKAGSAGRGFADVVTEIGELAARSSMAAKAAGILAARTLEGVEGSRTASEKTMELFDGMAEQIEKTSAGIKDISDMVRQNVSAAAQAMDSLELILKALEQSVEIFHHSEQVSVTIAEETGNLLRMAEP